MSESRFQFDVAAFFALPLVRRLHQALAVGLAVFMLTLAVLHEPFHGYLAEVHLSGPGTAGLDLDDAVLWLKKAEPHLAAVATPAGEISAKCEIRATFVARHPKPALSHLDELADRWLYQYLPDRLQAYRHGVLANLRTAVAETRQREDASHERLEELRQRQVAEMGRSQESGAGSQESEIRRTGAAAGTADSGSKMRERLETLRVQLSHLTGSHTDEHPEIVTIKSQISALERQLEITKAAGAQPGDSLNRGLAPGERQTKANAAGASPGETPAPSLSASGDIQQTSGVSDAPVTPIALEISDVASQLSLAARERQAAEQHLTERMQELSSEPTAAQWSAGPAHIVTRLGGTPRSLTLALAGVLAVVAGIVMFRATVAETAKAKIESSDELAEALKVPVVGDLGAVRESGVGSRESGIGTSQPDRRRIPLLTPARLRIVTSVAEGFVAVASAACVISVVVDPSLGRQVLADPFGTLSEVVGRFGA